jgi:ATP-dependent protease ClpP protease subunit
MRNIYLERMREKHPDYLEEDLDKLLNFDTILNPYEAVELGLADRVVM